jgi:dihydroorotase
MLSIGFTDLKAEIGEPGFEQRETQQSAMASAKAGGYTRVAVTPNLSPVTDNQAAVNFIQRKNTDLFQFLPFGSISEKMEGKQLAGFHEMKNAGAIGFTENNKQVSTELMLRALEYARQIHSRIFTSSNDKSIHPNALIHEGITSTAMGVKGASEISETIHIQRDLSLLKYTQSKLHFFSVSTAKGVDLIRKAKKEGLDVTCSVAAHQLCFVDTDMKQFDSNKKVWPPFRSTEDRTAIIKGLADGTIDAIESQHTPIEIEGKELEFEDASFGISSFQTAFITAAKALEDKLSVEQILEKFTTSPSQILEMPAIDFEVGSPARLVLFNPKGETTVDVSLWKSKSKNTPYFGQTLAGSVTPLF